MEMSVNWFEAMITLIGISLMGSLWNNEPLTNIRWIRVSICLISILLTMQYLGVDKLEIL